MASADEIFYKEFKQMMGELKSMNGNVDLYDVPMPPSLEQRLKIEKRDMVAIAEIPDQYYGKLGNSFALLWGRGRLARRKYDYKGEYMLDKNGNFTWQDVTVPQDCVAILSDRSIGVPNSYKPKGDHFEYVEMVVKKVGDKELRKFVYIIPRKYCYKVNQTALVLSWNKLRVYYSSISLAMRNGNTLFIGVVPYKPTSNTTHNYRVLMSKPSVDYNEELAILRDYWIKQNVIFNPAHCVLYTGAQGRDNAAMQAFNGVLDTYMMFDANKPLGEDDSIMDEVEDSGSDE